MSHRISFCRVFCPSENLPDCCQRNDDFERNYFQNLYREHSQELHITVVGTSPDWEKPIHIAWLAYPKPTTETPEQYVKSVHS